MIPRMTTREPCRRLENSLRLCPHVLAGRPTFGCSTYGPNLTHTPGSFRPSWSPDGKWIAFSSDRNTPVRRLDAERLAQVHAVSIYVMRADGTDVRRLTPASKFAGSPKWSPDSKRVVFYEMEIQDTYNAMRPGFGRPVDSQIVSLDIATGVRQEHTSGPGLKVSPLFLSENSIGYARKAGLRMGWPLRLEIRVPVERCATRLGHVMASGWFIRNGPLNGPKTCDCLASIRNLIRERSRASGRNNLQSATFCLGLAKGEF
jgi:hypothetical protein